MREKKIRSPLLSLAKSIHYFNHFVCPYGPALSAMGGIMKVIVSFFFRKGEEVAIELHRSRVLVDKDNHTKVFEFKKHLTEFLGLKEQALRLELVVTR